MPVVRHVTLPLATFLSAFLLFLLEPLIAKQVLPWFGGAPAVWTTCLVFFQLALVVGYAYAHLTRRLGLRRQATLHLVLLAMAFVALPVVLSPSWKPVGDASPGLRITAMLSATIGLPYVLLSATAPLLQDWAGRADLHANPYRLYVTSNAGSLVALLSYPILFERWMTVPAQAWSWSALFILLVLTIGATVVGLRAGPRPQGTHVEAPHVAPAERASRPRVIDRALWLLLSACGSALLLAVTNQLCQDVAVVPLLWVAPLSLYLITFILAFAGWYRRPVWVVLYGAALAACWVVLARAGSVPLAWSGAGLLAAMTAGCMVCHGELVRKQPHAEHLTAFYLSLAAGGAAGGMFVSVAAPNLFTTYAELPLTLVLVFLLVFGSWASERPGIPAFLVLAPLVVFLLAGTMALRAVGTGPHVQIAMRDFYGILRVVDGTSDDASHAPVRRLFNGQVLHGAEFTDPARSLVPTMYYGAGSGIDVAIRAISNEHPAGLRIGVIGLGAGTIAAWGRPGDRLRFFELNPNVVDLARRFFRFVPDSHAAVEIVTGDGRLALERETSAVTNRHQYDLLAVDAFSGDSVPAHLLTREALGVYRDALTAQGVLAMHISNRFLNLSPVVLGLAREAGWEAFEVHRDADPSAGVIDSVWMLLTSDAQFGDRAGAAARQVPQTAGSILWTDAYSSLVGILR